MKIRIKTSTALKDMIEDIKDWGCGDNPKCHPECPSKNNCRDVIIEIRKPNK